MMKVGDVIQATRDAGGFGSSGQIRENHYYVVVKDIDDPDDEYIAVEGCYNTPAGERYPWWLDKNYFILCLPSIEPHADADSL